LKCTPVATIGNGCAASPCGSGEYCSAARACSYLHRIGDFCGGVPDSLDCGYGARCVAADANGGRKWVDAQWSVRRMGDDCESDIDCLVPVATCVDGRCVRRPGIGDPCSEDGSGTRPCWRSVCPTFSRTCAEASGLCDDYRSCYRSTCLFEIQHPTIP